MPHHKATILVVDNDLDTLSKIYINLLLNNYIIEVTNNALEIMERLHRLKPDVLILNNELHGLNAHDVCSLVKKEWKAPIILLVEETAIKSASLDGCQADMLFPKPINVTELKQAITALMRAKQSA